MKNRLPADPNDRNLEKMPMVKGQNGTMVRSMMVRMRCEACLFDHRFLTAEDTPLQVLPEIMKSTCRCNCKRHIPTITKMDKSLMSINGVPLAQLKAMAVASNPHAPKGALN